MAEPCPSVATLSSHQHRTPCRLHIRSTPPSQDSWHRDRTGGPAKIDQGVAHMSRVIAAILLIAVLVLGGGIIATTAYNAGVTAGTTVTTTTDGATTVAPVVVAPYAYGWHGWGWGWGFFGFLFFLFFLFIVFGLIRAIFWGGRRGWGGGGWGGGYGPGGYYGWKDPNGRGRWESGNDRFDEWHRRAHGESPTTPDSSQSGPPTPPTSTGVA